MLRLRLLALLVPLAAAIFAAACGGLTEDDAAVCTTTPPPALVTDARVVRLDALRVGDVVPGDAASKDAWKTLGFDLDGVCSSRNDPASLACRRVAGSSANVSDDGTNGIDNAFGHSLLPLFSPLFASPGRAMSGFSFLATKSDGTGTLYLGSKDGLMFVVPLASVRLSPPAADGSVTLGAIAPRDAVVATFVEHANLLARDLCDERTTLDSIAADIRQAADVRVSGAPDPNVECDGISFGMAFVPAQVDAPPPVQPGCSARDAGR